MAAQGIDQKQTTTTTGPELIARARALTTLLAEHAAEAERQRKPVAAAIRALEEAEIFKLMVPQSKHRTANLTLAGLPCRSRR